jgi:protein-tyrosine sulfotransferase
MRVCCRKLDKSPIFIGGAGRSGTTLLRVILDTHPNIVCGPEFKIIPSIAEHWANTARSYESVLQSYNLSPEKFSSSYASFILDLLGPLLEKSGKQRIAEKSPNNVFYFYHLNQMFPESPLVHLIRDGRDVVCSLLTMNWMSADSNKKLPYTESAAEAARYWVQAVTTGRKAGSTPSAQRKYFEVRYEDIIQNPESTLRSLFTALDEPWDPCVLEFHTKKRDLGEESSASQASQKMYSSSLGRWERDLADEDKYVVKRVAGDLLIELGYAKSSDW